MRLHLPCLIHMCDLPLLLPRVPAHLPWDLLLQLHAFCTSFQLMYTPHSLPPVVEFHHAGRRDNHHQKASGVSCFQWCRNALELDSSLNTYLRSTVTGILVSQCWCQMWCTRNSNILTTVFTKVAWPSWPGVCVKRWYAHSSEIWGDCW